MADDKNMELDDEMMAKADGGAGGESAAGIIIPYKVGDRVLIKGDEGQLQGTIRNVHEMRTTASYDVEFDNGKINRVNHKAITKL